MSREQKSGELNEKCFPLSKIRVGDLSYGCFNLGVSFLSAAVSPSSVVRISALKITASPPGN